MEKIDIEKVIKEKWKEMFFSDYIIDLIEKIKELECNIDMLENRIIILEKGE